MKLTELVTKSWELGAPQPAVETKELSAGHGTESGRTWWWSKAGAMRQLRDVGSGTSSSIVVACLRVLTDSFTEAPTAVYETDAENADVIVEPHPMTELLDRPNPYMTSDSLWQHYIWSSRVDGNAYYFKERSAAGRVVELWPLRPDLISPRVDAGSPNFIDYYSYRPTGTEVRIPPSEILHLKYGLDPSNHRLGLAPLKVVLKEILGDEEASRFASALLSNMAIPGVILSPNPGEPGPRQPDADQIKEKWTERFGKDRRGEPLVLTGAMNVETVAFSPSELDLTALRRVPEERVAAVLGVPAILAGLGAGLTSSSGRSESVTLIESFTEQTIIPDWRRVGRQLTVDLLPEWEPVRSNGTIVNGRWTDFDKTDVRALQDDENEIWDRADVGIRGGWLLISEGKKMVGLEPGPNDDVYLRSIGTEAVSVDETVEANEPPPEPAPIPPQFLNGGEPAEPEPVEEPVDA